jgi:hypothetical protein
MNYDMTNIIFYKMLQEGMYKIFMLNMQLDSCVKNVGHETHQYSMKGCKQKIAKSNIIHLKRYSLRD